jgi:UDP-N-acetylmuramate--alanine ligase
MMFRGTIKGIHFVGIGGIGMSGIAEVLLTQGFTVTGSDLKEGAAVKRLRKMGAEIFIGHRPENIGDADVVVRSTAVNVSNPEVSEALRRMVPVIRRAEMLAELMRLKHGIAIAGTHGKTTITSMLATCLASGGLDPTIVIGGRLDSLGGTNARLGTGDYLVAEADESDGSFLYLSPAVALVSNIDREHLDHHGTMDALKNTFLEFIRKVPFYGFAVLCIDHPVVQAMVPDVGRRVVTYGFARTAMYRPANLVCNGLRSEFDLYRLDDCLGRIALGMPGRHNVANAVGAAAVAAELGMSFEQIAQALDGFTGIQRRFTVRGEKNGVIVVDDYGHHPVEIEATLSAAEDAYPNSRIVAVFQPHRYSRVHDLYDAFCAAFNRAGHVVVCPVYGAGEVPIEGVNSMQISEDMRRRGHRGVVGVASLDEAREHILEIAEEGDLVITLGAGHVNSICEPLLQQLGG